MADDAQHFAGVNPEAHVVQNRNVRIVSERDIAELDCPLDLDFAGIVGLLDLGGLIEPLVYGVGLGRIRRKPGGHLGQGVQGRVEKRQVAQERQQGAQGQFVGVRLDQRGGLHAFGSQARGVGVDNGLAAQQPDKIAAKLAPADIGVNRAVDRLTLMPASRKLAL